MQLRFGLLEILLCPQFLFQRGNALIGKATGVDQGKIAQVGIDIQRKAVHGDIPAALHPDGTYLTGTAFYFGVDPDAGRSFQPFPFYPIERQEADNDFFQGVDILFQSQLPVFEVEYRIAGDLSGAVIGDIPSPVRVEEGNTPLFQQLGRDQQVSVFPLLPIVSTGSCSQKNSLFSPCPPHTLACNSVSNASV